MLISDFEPRQVLFWVNDTDHAFKFRNHNSANETVDFKTIAYTTSSTISPLINDDGNLLTTESIPVTERPDWKQTFDKTLDSVFNRQKRYANDSNESVDESNFDFKGEQFDFPKVNQIPYLFISYL